MMVRASMKSCALLHHLQARVEVEALPVRMLLLREDASPKDTPPDVAARLVVVARQEDEKVVFDGDGGLSAEEADHKAGRREQGGEPTETVEIALRVVADDVSRAVEHGRIELLVELLDGAASVVGQRQQSRVVAGRHD